MMSFSVVFGFVVMAGARFGVLTLISILSSVGDGFGGSAYATFAEGFGEIVRCGWSAGSSASVIRTPPIPKDGSANATSAEGFGEIVRCGCGSGMGLDTIPPSMGADAGNAAPIQKLTGLVGVVLTGFFVVGRKK
jgi:hypothetical protein